MQKPRRFLCALLALMMVIATIPKEALAYGLRSSKGIDSINLSASEEELTEEALAELIKENGNPELLKDYDLPGPTDEVDVIVTLKGDSLVEKRNSLGLKSMSVADFAVSKQGKAVIAEMSKAQESVKKEIKALGIDIDTKYSYSTLLNGFSMSVEYGRLAEIKALNNVESVVLSILYEKEETTDGEEVMGGVVNSLATNGYANTSDYKGQGMVIGILDTGLDYHHEAFKNGAKDARITKNDLKKMLHGITEDNKVETYSIASYWYANKNFDGYDLNTLLSVDDIYMSEKVPFAFDYADIDTDVNPSATAIEEYGNDHGTHVAGIASGKTIASNGDVTFSGVAPEAQLAIFKVFSDSSNSAATVDILAGLCDAVLLGVDVINMSLGSSGGFGQEEAGSLLDQVYGLVADSGIILNCSAGNAYSASYSSNVGDMPLVTNPDTGIISSASSYDMALSVASINASATKTLKAGDNIIPYNDIDGHDFASELEEGSYEYVMVPGYGNLEDYAGIDVTGKVAVVKRGSLTFNDKQVNAAQMGAIACIIYNNRDGYILNMAIDTYMIPTIAISLGSGQVMEGLSDKKITISKGAAGYTTMSDFSSWGPLPSLELKPEITAPGGGIYSSLPGGSYGYMSGTSMASPYMAGAGAVLKEYLSQRYPTMSDNEIEILSNRIYMSTAKVYNEESGAAYSPRKQGAGVVDINSALNTRAYLYVKGEDKPKVELGDDKEETGVYNISFHVVNMTPKPISYNIATLVLTETASEDGTTIEQKGYPLEGADTSSISVWGKASLNGKTITVSGNGDATVTVKVVLTEENKKYMRDTFENGIYVEGFVKLEPVDDKDVELSIPYLAFFGDWTKAPMLDVDAFSNEDAIMYATDVLGVYAMMYLFPAGSYLFNLPEGAEEPAKSKDKIAMGLGMGNGISNLYPLAAGLLRGAKTADITISDKDTDQIYYQSTATNIPRARYSSNGAIVPGYVGDIWPSLTSYSGLDSNTRLAYNADFHLDYDEPQNTKGDTSYSFDLMVDGEAPYIVNRDNLKFYKGKDSRMYMDVVLEDNQYLMAATLYSATKKYSSSYPQGIIAPNSNYYDYMTPVYNSEPNKQSEMTFDVTDFYDDLYDGTLYVLAYDYAMNECCYKIQVPKVAPTAVEISNQEITIKTNEVAQLTAKVLPDNCTSKKIRWTSSDSSIVMVQDGEITGMKPGVATISAISTNVSSVKATCTVTVSNESVDPIEVTGFDVDSPAISMFAGESRENRIIDWEPYNATNKEITWSSSDNNVATVAAGTTNYMGDPVPAAVVTGVSIGTAVITGTTKGGASASFTVSVVEPSGSFTIDGTVLKSYTGQETVINIPDGITDIADNAFGDNDYIKVVNFPDTVKSIGYRAFYSCGKLITVNLPEAMESIGEDAFYDCEALENLSIPKGLTQIAPETFCYCKALKDVTIPNTVATIGNRAFYGCSSFTEIIMPESITSLDEKGGQWQSCKNVTRVEISSKLTSLPSNCFMGLESITELPDLKNVTVLGNACFHSAYSIKNLVIPEQVDSIGNLCFAYSMRELDDGNIIGIETAEFKGNPTTVGSGIFDSDGLLTTVTGKLTTIGKNMFEDCNALVDFTIPDEVTSIGERAFYYCKNLETIRFSADSKFKGESGSIGLQPFYACSKFKGIVVEQGNTNLTVDDNGFIYNSDKTNLVYVPSNFNGTTVTLPEGLKCIGDYAFYEVAKNLTSISIPESVTYIGDYAFYGCAKLTSLAIPNNTTYIGSNAFYNATAITSLALGSSVETIGNSAFSGCKALKTVNFPASLKTIGDSAFYNCAALTELTLPGGLVSIGKSAFRGCSMVPSIILPNSLESMGTYAFYGCRAAKEINTGSLTAIPADAFYECSKAEKITISDKVTDIEEYAFYKPSVLKEFIWPSALESIGNYAFYFPYQLTSLDLSGTKVKAIGNYAFYQCYSINDLVLPETLETIGTRSFGYMNYYGTSSSYGCKQPVTEVYIPENVTTIPADTFYYATYLQRIVVAENNPVYTSTKEGLLLIKDTGVIHIWPLGNTTSEFTIPENITDIPSSMFANNKTLKKIVIPGHVTSVGSSAFSGSAIEEVVFEKSINGITIGSSAFYNCKSLKSVTLPKGLTSIGSSAFQNDTKLESVVIPGTVLNIENSAFRLCTALKNVTLEGGISTIQYGVFNGCTSLKEITIPKSVSFIATETTNSFYDCTALENILVEDGSYYYMDIDGVLFDANGKTLRLYPLGKTAEEYTVPEGVTRLGYRSFGDNTALKKVYLPSTLQRVGDIAFYGCDNLNDYYFYGDYVPLLEIGTYLSSYTTQIGFYGNFKDFFCDTSGSTVVMKDLGLNLYYPEGGQGYNTRVWKAFFDTENGSVTEMTVDNMLGIKSITADQLDNTHNVQLDWSEPEWATSYKLERSIAKAVDTGDQLTYLFDGFETLGTITNNSYLDEDLPIGITLAYRITAIKGEGDSAIYGPAKYVFVTIEGINADENAAAKVIKAIEELKPVDMLTADNKDAVAMVRSMYQELTETQKALVNNYAVLIQAENQVEADVVERAINAIPNPVALEDEDVIKAAREAYDALTEEGKVLVDNYNTLLAAEAELSALKESIGRVNAVEALIDAIGDVTLDDADLIRTARATYDALSYDEKAQVENYNTLLAAEEVLSKLQAEEKEKEESAKRIAEVEALIDAIGDVTLESENAVKAARSAYDALSDAEKAKVGNYNKLLAAEEVLSKLQAEEKEKQESAKRIAEVEALIDAIGNVTSGSEKTIKAARSAYDALLDAEKAEVGNYNKLLAAEKAFKELKKEDVKTGDSTNASLWLFFMIGSLAVVVYMKKKREQTEC